MSPSRLINRFMESRFQLTDGLPYWREKIFNGIILVFFIVGTIAIVPNLIASLKADFVAIFIIDSLIYATLLIITFVKQIKLTIKINITIFSIYLLSILLLVYMGPFGPGLIWITSGSVFVALFLGFKKTIISIFVNVVVVFALALLIHLNIFTSPFFEAYKLLDWIAIGLNVVVISSVCSIPVSILIRGLETTINEEKALKLELLRTNKQVSEEMLKAKEADKLKSSFLANLSHEIRTPMNAIAGFSELINMEDNLPSKIKKYSDQIYINSDYLQNIINDIVDISIIEAGQIKIRNEKFSISKFMAELKTLVDTMILRKKRASVKILYFYDSSLEDKEILFDKNHLRQILVNFITNSLKYTLDGEIEIRCESIKKELVFSVRDSGMGIPEPEKDKIFTRFSKIDHNKKIVVQGMGIGLSIVKGLSDALGGKVWFESAENRGSCFYFSFPFTADLFSEAASK